MGYASKSRSGAEKKESFRDYVAPLSHPYYDEWAKVEANNDFETYPFLKEVFQNITGKGEMKIGDLEYSFEDFKYDPDYIPQIHMDSVVKIKGEPYETMALISAGGYSPHPAPETVDTDKYMEFTNETLKYKTNPQMGETVAGYMGLNPEYGGEHAKLWGHVEKYDKSMVYGAAHPKDLEGHIANDMGIDYSKATKEQKQQVEAETKRVLTEYNNLNKELYADQSRSPVNLMVARGGTPHKGVLLSTTFDREVAGRFAYKRNEDTYEIAIKKGTPMLSTETYAFKSGASPKLGENGHVSPYLESEIILPVGTSLKKTKEGYYEAVAPPEPVDLIKIYEKAKTKGR